MRVDLFDFDLPQTLIAQTAAEPRDGARLLHVGDVMTDKIVRDLPQLLNAGDIMVFNNSKVIPARLFAQVSGKSLEVLLHKSVVHDDTSDLWQCFARPARKLTVGMHLSFAPDFDAVVEGKTEDGQVLLRFDCAGVALFDKLRAHGHMPLPPYIARADTKDDASRYQTMYAAHDGSVAAPTAGLHFTPALMDALKARGVHIAFVTLHVGAGTFQPVKVDNTDAHIMHSEWLEMTQETADSINEARARGGKVIAAGTTSLRVLESVAREDGTLAAYTGDTDIFITPGYRFKIVDRLMTNFHLPRSTLFMLVSAFAGFERMQSAYAHAIASQYRFYSYGDTSLLERAS